MLLLSGGRCAPAKCFWRKLTPEKVLIHHVQIGNDSYIFIHGNVFPAMLGSLLECIIIWKKDSFIGIIGETPLLNDHFQRWTGRLFSHPFFAGNSWRQNNTSDTIYLPLSSIGTAIMLFSKFPGYIVGKCTLHGWGEHLCMYPLVN